MDAMKFKVSLVTVVVIQVFYWLSINQQEVLLLRVGLPLRVTSSGGPGKNLSKKDQAPFQRIPLRATPSGGPAKNLLKDQAPFQHLIYAASGGRLGNNLYSLAATYAIAKMNHRKLALAPNYVKKIKNFLNMSYLDFETADAPPTLVEKQQLSIKKEYLFQYEHKLEHLRDEDVKVGYIQVMRYFVPYAGEIRDLFKINTNLVTSTQEFLHDLHVPHNSVFVGIHVRRGDMISKRLLAMGQQTPKIRYFEKAMNFFLSKYSNYSTVQFIVCSDDLPWCVRNLMSVRLNWGSWNSSRAHHNKHKSFGDPTVNHSTRNLHPQRSSPEYGIHFSPGLSREFDLALLAECNDSIMSVGTFGWWGGWLAGGDVIYFNHPIANRSNIGINRLWVNEDFFWPTWIGMDDK